MDIDGVMCLFSSEQSVVSLDCHNISFHHGTWVDFSGILMFVQ